MKAVLFVLLPILFLGVGALAFLTLRADEPAYRGGGPGGAGSAVSTVPVATISHGEDVDLARHAVPNGRTIFEYTADW